LVCDLFSYSLLRGLFFSPKLNKSVAKLNYRIQKHYSEDALTGEQGTYVPSEILAVPSNRNLMRIYQLQQDK
jgi:hypothetical protein